MATEAGVGFPKDLASGFSRMVGFFIVVNLPTCHDVEESNMYVTTHTRTTCSNTHIVIVRGGGS